MTVLIYPLPTWPAAIWALWGLFVFWAGWHACNWSRGIPKPSPWRPHRPAHHGPIRDAASYGRHAAATLPDGTRLELEEPRHLEEVTSS